MDRRRPGKERIEEALLELLKTKHLDDISISELCSFAHTSRSTFYTHYSHVEEIYRHLVETLISGTRTLKDQLKNPHNEIRSLRRPFCEIIQTDRFAGLTKEDRFIQTFIDICSNQSSDDAFGIYSDVVNDSYVAKMIYVFQITGCMAAAKIGKNDPNWATARKAIDAFIQGGMNTLRQ